MCISFWLVSIFGFVLSWLVLFCDDFVVCWLLNSYVKIVLLLVSEKHLRNRRKNGTQMMRRWTSLAGKNVEDWEQTIGGFGRLVKGQTIFL